MARGIAGRIRFRFHDTAAEPARWEIVDYGLSDEEARKLDRVRRKLGSAKAPDREFRRQAFWIGARRRHGILIPQYGIAATRRGKSIRKPTLIK